MAPNPIKNNGVWRLGFAILASLCIKGLMGVQSTERCHVARRFRSNESIAIVGTHYSRRSTEPTTSHPPVRPYIIRHVISIDIAPSPSRFFHPISSLFVSRHVRASSRSGGGRNGC